MDATLWIQVQLLFVLAWWGCDCTYGMYGMDRVLHSLRVGWRNFFSSCAVVSVFWFWWEIVLGVTYLPYQLCRCVFFWLRREIVLGCTDKISFLVVERNSFRCYLLIYHTSCAVVSVFWLRQEIVFSCTVSKKNSYSDSLNWERIRYKEGQKFPSFPSHCLNYSKWASSCFEWAQSHPWNCLCNLKILSRYL